jgi:hypothetical protein
MSTELNKLHPTLRLRMECVSTKRKTKFLDLRIQRSQQSQTENTTKNPKTKSKKIGYINIYGI